MKLADFAEVVAGAPVPGWQRDILEAMEAQARAVTGVAEAQLPSCRYCREPVIRNVPCKCERAQEEARRIRAAS